MKKTIAMILATVIILGVCAGGIAWICHALADRAEENSAMEQTGGGITTLGSTTGTTGGASQPSTAPSTVPTEPTTPPTEPTIPPTEPTFPPAEPEQPEQPEEPEEPKQPGVFQIGYSRANITPSYSVPLAGYGNTSMRMSTGIQSNLYTTCIAITGSDGTTILQFQNDLISSANWIMKSIRKSISKETEVPESNIMIAATHTHSAPDINSSEESIVTYREDLKKAMVTCAVAAMADRKPATQMKTGSVAVPVNTLNFVRHYTTEAGVVKGDNFNDLVSSPYTGHTHDADSSMQLIQFSREEGKDVVMVNWQSHPHRGGGSKNYNITADIVGEMRDHFEEETDSLFIYYTGASGNINPSSRIAKENVTADFYEQGKALADYAVKCYNESMEVTEFGDPTITYQSYAGTVNHTEDHLVDEALLVQQEWTTNNDFIAAVTLANQYGINSPYHANAIINKSKKGETMDVKMYAYSIGDVAFITAPYEMFDENGVYVKENSPFAMTFVITCCNDTMCYIPSIEGYNNQCYGANTGYFIPGTGETLAKEYVSMLNGLYND